MNQVYFGIIINHSEYGADYETNNEIEFGPDAVDHVYVKKNKGNLLDYFYEFTGLQSGCGAQRIRENS